MRKLFNYPPLLLLLNTMLGIVLGKKYAFDLIEVLCIMVFCAVAILMLIICMKSRSFSKFLEAALFCIVCSVIGVFVFSVNDIRKEKDFYGNKCLEDAAVMVAMEIRETLKSNRSFDRFKAEVVQVNGSNSKGTVLLNFKKDTDISLQAGNLFIAKTQLQHIITPKNPYEFNYANYLAHQQIYHQVFVESKEIEFVQRGTFPFFVRLQKFRAELIQKISKKGIKKDELAVISALLLGERDYLSAELRNSYTNAGAIHILAISGLHVGILFLLISFMLKPLHSLPFGNVIAQLLILIVMWLFAMLAGLSPSVVRAVTMFSFISIGIFLNRKNSVYQSLIASAFILLLIHPRFLFEVGFQLSYTAVFFIVWLQPKIERLWKPKFKMLNYFWKLMTVSCAAQLGVLPLSLYYFHQFPALFFLSNLIIIPILGLLLGIGIFVLLLIEFEIQATLIIEAYSKVISVLNEIIAFIAGFESFVIKHIFWSAGLLITAYLVLVTFFKYIESKTWFRFGLAFFAIMVFYGVLFYEVGQQKEQHELVLFHKSRTTLIGKLEGRHMQIMGSDESEVLGFIKNYLSSKGVKNITYSKKLSNFMFFNKQQIVLIDSLGLYNYSTVKNPIVLLRNSPKINLDRLVGKLNPLVVVADGSNYRSYVTKWEWSAKKTKTPFYDTSQKGAFILYK